MDEFLREAIRTRRWTIPEFAEACDVAPGLAQKWISRNPRYLVTPGPASCEKIAQALGVDVDYVLELAGHRKRRADNSEPVNAKAAALLAQKQQAIRERRDRWVVALGPKMGEEAAEDYFWADQIAHADSRLDLYERIESAVSEAPKSAVSRAISAQRRRSRRNRDDDKGPLMVSQRLADRRSALDRRVLNRPIEDAAA